MTRALRLIAQECRASLIQVMDAGEVEAAAEAGEVGLRVVLAMVEAIIEERSQTDPTLHPSTTDLLVQASPRSTK